MCERAQQKFDQAKLALKEGAYELSHEFREATFWHIDKTTGQRVSDALTGFNFTGKYVSAAVDFVNAARYELEEGSKDNARQLYAMAAECFEKNSEVTANRVTGAQSVTYMLEEAAECWVGAHKPEKAFEAYRRAAELREYKAELVRLHGDGDKTSKRDMISDLELAARDWKAAADIEETLNGQTEIRKAILSKAAICFERVAALAPKDNQKLKAGSLERAGENRGLAGEGKEAKKDFLEAAAIRKELADAEKYSDLLAEEDRKQAERDTESAEEWGGADDEDDDEHEKPDAPEIDLEGKHDGAE